MRYVAIALLIILPFQLLSQIKIEGVVSNNHSPLALTNIEVYNETNTVFITYAISDVNGLYEVSVEKGTYVFKISYLGYKTHLEKMSIDRHITKNFILQEDATALDQITIKSQSLDVTMDNDTINYNLKRLTNGTEDNLKEILKKLPGVEFDENGKILANGKKIDQLLIDGKEFFGNQHQLATENISAEMIEGISLLKNFKEFSEIDPLSHTGKMAMNIEIKEEYQGQLKGDLSAMAGYSDRYDFHMNMFAFWNKTHFSFIGNANNQGRQVFTIEDYLSFQGGVEKIRGNNSPTRAITINDLPGFLSANNNVESKSEQLAAVNFIYRPSKKLGLNSYTIFDRLDIAEEQRITQTYFTKSTNLIQNKSISKDHSFHINTTYVDATYKPTENTILNYTLHFSPYKDQMESLELFDEDNFGGLKKDKGYRLNQFLDVKQKIGKKSNMVNTLYYSKNQSENELNINASRDFLDLEFKNNDFSAIQKLAKHIEELGYHALFSNKLGEKYNLNLKYDISKVNNNFESNGNNYEMQNEINYNRTENKVGVGLSKNDRSLINFNLGCDYSLVTLAQAKRSNFLPYVSFQLNFKRTHSLSVGYHRTTEFPAAENLITNKIFTAYNRFMDNQNVSLSNITTHDNFSVNYFIYDMFSGSLLTLGGTWIKASHPITTNTIHSETYLTNRYTFTRSSTVANTYLLFDKKFSKIPFSVRLKSTYSSLNHNNFIEYISNSIRSKTWSSHFILSSRFDHPFFNFEAGYKYKVMRIENVTKSTSTAVDFYNPYFNFSLTAKNIKLLFNNALEMYVSDTSKTQFYNMSPEIIFSKKGQRWSFHLRGENVFNLNKNRLIESLNYLAYFEHRIIYTMGGYVVVGVKYTF